MSGTVNRKKLRARRVLAVAAAAVFVLAAVLAFCLRDSIAADPVPAEDAWRLEAGSSRVYGVCGNSLVSASSTGVQAFDKNGAELLCESFSMTSPSLRCAGGVIAVWDTGGTALRIADAGGSVTALEPTGNITCVSVSESGHVAVLAAQEGWKGVVTVYDDTLTAVYRWYSGTDYPLAAEVSPDGERLAVITASSSGGRVRMFSLDSEQELGNYLADGELITCLGWISASECCALTSGSAVFLDRACAVTGQFGFEGLRLGGLDFGGDGFVTVALAKYLSGDPNVLVTLGASGRVLGRLETDGGITCVDALGNRVLCCTENEAVLYSQALEPRDSADARGVCEAFLLKNGNAIVIDDAKTVSLIRF